MKMTESKLGRPFKYDWDKWFNDKNFDRGGFTLVQGKDFDSKIDTMARLLRTRAEEYEWKAKVRCTDRTVKVEVVKG